MRGALGRRALEDHASAVGAGAGSHLHDAVRGEHHVTVMLDHHQRVAQVAQAVDGSDQPAVVGGVQADARLVEHVGHADQSEAQLGR